MSYIPVLSFNGHLEQDETWISKSYKLQDTYLSSSVTMQVPDDTKGSLEIWTSNDDVTYYVLNVTILETGGPDIVTMLTNTTGFYLQVRYYNTGAARDISIVTKLRQDYVI